MVQERHQPREKNYEDVFLFVVLIVFGAIVCIGCMTYWLVQPPSQAEIDLVANTILHSAANVRPEPKEKITYFVLLAILPIALTFATLIARSCAPEMHKAIHRSTIVATIVSFTMLLVADPFWLSLLAPLASYAWSIAIVAAFVAGAHYLQWQTRLGPFVAKFGERATLLTALFVVLISSCWRIFDIHSISRSVAFVDHYEAAAYSVAQIANGGTCLIDVIPQYGCYGEWTKPILRLVGVSTLSITMVLSAFQLVAMVAICVIARKLIRNSYILALTVLLLTIANNSIWQGADDPFFQASPIRLLFPALSMLVALGLLNKCTTFRSFAAGCFAGLAMTWNLDTGSVVAIALISALLIRGCTAANWRLSVLAAQAFYLIVYIASVMLSLGIAILYLRVKGGSWPSISEYYSFQQLFFIHGVFSLPMSALPSLWGVFVSVAIISLCMLAAKVGRGPRDSRFELLGFVSILALGLLSYYVGRSHWQTLALVSWPFLIISGALADRAWSAVLQRSSLTRIAGVGAISMAIVYGFLIVESHGPNIMNSMLNSWGRYVGTVPSETVFSDVEFIRRHIPKDTTVAMIALNMAPLFADTGLKSAIAGMSWTETLRRSDAERQVNQILASQIDHLVMSAFLIEAPGWVKNSIPAIRQRYSLVEWSETGSLAHLVPRKDGQSVQDLFDDKLTKGGDFFAVRDPVTDRIYGRWRRPLPNLTDWPFQLRSNFRISLRFSISSRQPPYATLINTMDGGGNGLSIEADSTGTSMLLWLGVGDTMRPSATFHLEPDVQHTLVLTATNGRITLDVDEKSIFQDPLEYSPSYLRLLLGKSLVAGREMKVRLEEFHARTGKIESAE